MIKDFAAQLARSEGVQWDNIPIDIKTRMLIIAHEAQAQTILALKQIHEVAEETPEQNREEVSPQEDGYLDYCIQATAQNVCWCIALEKIAYGKVNGKVNGMKNGGIMCRAIAKVALGNKGE